MSKDTTLLSDESNKIIEDSDFYKMSRDYNTGLKLVCDNCKKFTDARILGLCAECFKIASEAELPEIIKH